MTVAPPACRLMREDKVGPWCIGDDGVAMRCGTTYSVTHAMTRERATLDVYSVAPLAFGSHTERLRSVMHALNQVGHPGIVKIHDVGAFADGRPYVVRERVEGMTLGALIAAKPLPEAESIAILRAVCDVLAAAHGADVVHRALVLEHVVVIAGGSVKLLDWGITDELVRPVKPGAMTARQMALSTDDVYAFGVIVHRLLRWVPRSLEALWISMLSVDPAARPTMPEIQEELGSAARSEAPRRTKPRLTAVPRIDTDVAPLAVPAPIIAAEIVERMKTVESLEARQPDEPVKPVETANTTDRRRKRMPTWWAVALTGAFAVPLLAIALVGSSTHDRRRVTAPTPAPAVTVQPVQPRPVEATPQAPAATVAVAEPTKRPLVRVAAATPNVRVAAKVTSRPTRLRAAAAVPATAAAASDDGERRTLVVQYQRVQHNLLLAKREFGPEAMRPLTERMQWVKLDTALATKTSRQLMAKTLQALQIQIDAAREARRSQ